MNLIDKLFTKKEDINPNYIYAPIVGEAVSVNEIPDPAFSSGALGNGIAILPTDGNLYAPVNGTVDMTFETGHAVCLTAENGAEILIHVGLGTVAMNGRPFEMKVQSGQKVKKGDLLLTADLNAIKAAGLSTIVPVMVNNASEFTTFSITSSKFVTNEDVVIELSK